MRHLESELQRACMRWLCLQHPKVKAFAIPNGGARSEKISSTLHSNAMKRPEKRKLTCWALNLKSKGFDTATLTVRGQNSNGTEMEIEITMQHYDMVEFHREALKIANTRLSQAQGLRESLLKPHTDTY